MSDAAPHSPPDDGVPERRSFVARVASAAIAVPLLGPKLLARSTSEVVSTGIQPNDTILAALADAVLPSELGADGVRRAVGDFQRWMDGYQPDAEAAHGYGTGRIGRLPADPRPAWKAQLQSMDAEARRSAGQSFAAMTRERRQALVRTALAGERGESLPSPLASKHIALALLSHFYDSATATDLCYESQIGRQQCRPLAAQAQRPTPLARRGR
jgi:hypothetical protein